MSWYDDLLNSTRQKLGGYGDALQDTAATLGNGLLGAAESAGALTDMVLGGGGPAAQLRRVQEDIAKNGFKYSGHDWASDLHDIFKDDPRYQAARAAARVAAPIVSNAANASWDSLSPTSKAVATGAGSLGLLGLNLLGPWAPEANSVLSAEHALAQSKGILGAIGGGKKATAAELAAAQAARAEEAAKAAEAIKAGAASAAEPGWAPQNTVTGYKLMRQGPDGQLYPLFVNADTPFAMDQWMAAAAGPQGENGVKSSIGDLAYRPGFHAGDSPSAIHIGGKIKGQSAPAFRKPGQVWAEVSMPDDVNWQDLANARASLDKFGNPVPATAHVNDQIPFGGTYRYKTNPNMQGQWMIGGNMKVNRLLTPQEIADINAAHGVADLPTVEDLLQANPEVYDRLPAYIKKTVPRPEPAPASNLLTPPAAPAPVAAPTVAPASTLESHINSPNWAAAPLADPATPALNVGLKVGDVEKLKPEDVVAAIEKNKGVKVLSGHVERSGTENTYIPRLSRPLTKQELHDLSVNLQQDAIAQRTGAGVGDLEGPKAAEWGGAYNDGYFLPSRDIKPDVAQIAGYPKIAPPELAFDKKKESWFWGKETSDEGDAVAKARKAAQEDIDAGNYNPYFNVAERKHVDPSNFPLTSDPMVESGAKTQKTMDKHRAEIDTPENYARLEQALLEGMKHPENKDWYAMGQLHDKYREVFAAQGKTAAEADAAFKRDFAQQMANTTGGADPTANLLSAHLANYMHEQGLAVPEKGYALPTPVGGRYIGGNMEMANNSRGLLEPSAAEQPKRNSFFRNFLGHLGFPTIDEQMTNVITPGLNAPKNGQYPVYANMVKRLADEYGIAPATAQEIIWGGAKGMKTGGGYTGKPMIQHYNEMIERTARVLGISPEEAVKGIILKKIPAYGFGGIAAASALKNRNLLSGDNGT